MPQIFSEITLFVLGLGIGSTVVWILNRGQTMTAVLQARNESQVEIATLN